MREDDVDLDSLATSAGGLVRQGERVRGVVPARSRPAPRGKSNWVDLIWTPFRVIIVTDQRILVATRSFYHPTRVLKVVSEHPLSTDVEGDFSMDNDNYVIRSLGKRLLVPANYVAQLNNLVKRGPSGQ